MTIAIRNGIVVIQEIVRPIGMPDRNLFAEFLFVDRRSAVRRCDFIFVFIRHMICLC